MDISEIYGKPKNNMSIINFFSGKKTYILGTLMTILGLMQGDTQMILNGLTIITGRAAIAKVS